MLKFGKVKLWRGGHAPHACMCPPCLRKRLAAFQARIEMMGDTMPPDWDHIVPVRPHWRKQPNFLQNADPHLREAIYGELESIVEETKQRKKRSA